METLINRITINPEVCHGKPTIRILDSFYVNATPPKLLFVSTGNIKNQACIFFSVFVIITSNVI